MSPTQLLRWLSVLVTIQSPIAAIQYVPQSNPTWQSKEQHWQVAPWKAEPSTGTIYSSHLIKTSAVSSSNQSTNQSRAVAIQSSSSNTIDDNNQQYNHNNSNTLQHFNPYQQSAIQLSVEEASNPIFCGSS